MAGEGTACIRLGKAAAKDRVLERVSRERTLDQGCREPPNVRMILLREFLKTIHRLVRNRNFHG